MKFEFFGWLTKGHMEVSMLDRLIGVAEFALLFAIIVIPWACYDVYVKNKRRK